MPVIVVKDYQWNQSQEFVNVHVQVKHAPKKVDLFVVDDYFKISFAPFMLELFLWQRVHEEQSKCIVAENELIFVLKKMQLGVEWPSLEMPNLSKETKRERRSSAIKNAHAMSKERSEREREKRKNLRDKSVGAQINLENVTLNKIKSMRDSYRERAMQELDQWAASTSEIVPEGNTNYYKNEPCKYLKNPDEKVNEENRMLMDDNGEKLKLAESSETWDDNFETDQDKEQTELVKQPRKLIVEKITEVKVSQRNVFGRPEKSVPLPRKTGKISVTFSERVFPTPARESHQVEEQEWLEKQAEARRKSGFVAEDLGPEEQDAQWLQDKGDEFLRVGNHLGAISAYTHGIQLSNGMASLYVKRSIAQYAIENYHRCIQDASKALELLVPECEGNRELRARCYARRGAALCQMSAPRHGIPELEHASKLLPSDESIRQDLEKAKGHFNLL